MQSEVDSFSHPSAPYTRAGTQGALIQAPAFHAYLLLGTRFRPDDTSHRNDAGTGNDRRRRRLHHDDHRRKRQRHKRATL